jgi:hypothetical protein
MDQNSFRVQMAVAGRERKEVAGLIAGHFRTPAVYKGAPGFEYSITEPAGREWRVDKTGAIITQGIAEDNVAEMFAVLKALEENGAEAVGQAAVTVTTGGHNGVTLRNLVNLLAAKERLIAKAMGSAGQSLLTQAMVTAVDAVRLKTVEDFLEATGGEESPGLAITRDAIVFRWFAATLDPEVIQAYIQFTLAVNKMALALKHSSPRETDTTNEKYSFRVFLLRLGFIGEEYSASRKLFLDRLSGNGSFRTKEQEQEAARRRKEKIL